MSTWSAPNAPSPVAASVTVPGSKSQTNRALVLAALTALRDPSAAPSTLTGALRSRDTDLMIGALRTLGADVEGAGADLVVRAGERPRDPVTVDCGLAGTVLRFVPPLAALGAATVTFDGDEQARARPLATLLDALRALGVDVSGTGLPFRVRGAGSLAGGRVAVDASASSQFVSGLLLAGAAFDQGLDLEHVGPAVPSAPHVAMTVAMLRSAGVEVDDTVPDHWRVPPGTPRPRDWQIEPDLSNAVPFLAAAIVTGGTVRVSGWPAHSVQPAGAVLELLERVGATVRTGAAHLEVAGPVDYPGFDADLHDVGELAPSVAALAALATPGSVSRLRGIAHLRGHETDRLAALTDDINGLGGQCEETADGLLVTARALHGGQWRAHADHRMATAGAIIGLRTPGVEVDDIATTAKTLPDFPAMWAGMLAGQVAGTP